MSQLTFLSGLLFCVGIGLNSVFVEAGCPYTFQQHGNNCYRIFSNLKASWSEAKIYCQVFGGDLLTIESKDEEMYIEGQLRAIHPNVTAGTPENYWLDGSDILAEGQWMWMSNEGNSRMIQGYTAWSPGQPDNAGNSEHCLEIRFTFNVQWNDYQCDVQQNFICKSTNDFEIGR